MSFKKRGRQKASTPTGTKVDKECNCVGASIILTRCDIEPGHWPLRSCRLECALEFQSWTWLHIDFSQIQKSCGVGGLWHEQDLWHLEISSQISACCQKMHNSFLGSILEQGILQQLHVQPISSVQNYPLLSPSGERTQSCLKCRT